MGLTIAHSSNVVAGYHGTSRANGRQILAEGFLASHNVYDWLGDGCYFFQDAGLGSSGFARASEWAIQQHGESQAVVVRASISLHGCLDLTTPEHFSLVSQAYESLLARAKKIGLTLPAQRGGFHGLDCVVLNYLVEILEEAGRHVTSVRAVFGEANRAAYPGSFLYDHDHVQIAVRDVGVLTALNLRPAAPA